MSDELINDILTPFSQPFDAVMVGPKNTIYRNQNSAVTKVLSHTDHDTHRYSVNMALLTPTEKLLIWDFYRERFGAADDFLFEDPDEHTVARNVIGVGDASETQFQLAALKGSYLYKRWDIQASPAPQIWIDGSLKATPADYTIDFTSSGIVTFTSPPSNTLDIEAAFDFYRRCIFVGRVQSSRRYLIDVGAIEFEETTVAA